jgi:hypothetical protein
VIDVASSAEDEIARHGHSNTGIISLDTQMVREGGILIQTLWRQDLKKVSEHTSQGNRT